MKRLFLAIGLAAFMMTSCCENAGNNENKGNCENNCKEQKEQCDHHECNHHECNHHGPQCQMPAEDRAEIEGIIDMMMNWDNLEDSVKVAGIAMAKARVEKCEAMKAEMEAAHDSLAPKCEGKHEGCKHECNHEGAPKHECNHEGMRPEGPRPEGCPEGMRPEGPRPEGCPEAPKCEGEHQCAGMMMTKEECDSKWAAFETLTLDEQKAVLCCKLHHCPGFMMVMHDKMAPKCDSVAPKCEGNHEGCQHQCK